MCRSLMSMFRNRNVIANRLNLNMEDAKYFIGVNTIENDLYDLKEDSINIMYKDGSIKDITEASELLNVEMLSKKIRKYYLCYQRI